MSEKPAREVISRRARPAKAPLSRDIIVDTALSMLAKEGLQGLSLRKVAVALDTGPASLYVYVENLSELYRLMLEQALGEVALPKSKSTPPRQRLVSLLSSYFKVLSARPGLAQLMMTVIPMGRNSFRMLDCLLGLLLEAGVGEQKAAWGADLLLLYVTSVAAEQDNRRQMGSGSMRLSHVERALAELPSDEFPFVARLRSALISGDGVKRFKWALEVVLDGVVAHA